MKAVDERRTVRHTPKRLMGRDREHLLHGEPLCGARIAPGSTTTLDAWVDCDTCVELMQEKKQ